MTAPLPPRPNKLSFKRRKYTSNGVSYVYFWELTGPTGKKIAKSFAPKEDLQEIVLEAVQTFGQQIANGRVHISDLGYYNMVMQSGMELGLIKSMD